MQPVNELITKKSKDALIQQKCDSLYQKFVDYANSLPPGAEKQKLLAELPKYASFRNS